MLPILSVRPPAIDTQLSLHLARPARSNPRCALSDIGRSRSAAPARCWSAGRTARRASALALGAVGLLLAAACGGRPTPRLDSVEYICDSVVQRTITMTYDDERLAEVTTTRYTGGGNQQVRRAVFTYDDQRVERIEYHVRIGTGEEQLDSTALLGYDDDRLASIDISYPDSSDKLANSFDYDDDRLVTYVSELNSSTIDPWEKFSCTATWKDDQLTEYTCREEETGEAPIVNTYKLSWDEDEGEQLSRLTWPDNTTISFTWKEGRLADIRGTYTLRMEYDDDGRIETMSGALSQDDQCLINIVYGKGDLVGVVPNVAINGLLLENSMLGLDGKLYKPEPLSLHLLL